MLADFAVPIRPCVRIAEIHSERHRAPPNGDSYSLRLPLFASHGQAPSQTAGAFSSPPELRAVLALIARSLMM